MIEICSADADVVAVAREAGFDPDPAVVLKSSFVCEDPNHLIDWQGIPPIRLSEELEELIRWWQDLQVERWARSQYVWLLPREKETKLLERS